MKANEILSHFIGLADWVDPKNTVDKIIVGDPEKEARSILVTWISSFSAVKAAVNSGADLLITHEPTFWRHTNELHDVNETEIGRIKKKYIDESNLVILRCHDVWDRMPEIGIPWSWAKFLGFTSRPSAIATEGFIHKYDVNPVTVEKLAKMIASKTASLGEPYVQVSGDCSKIISSVGIGTGCGCDPYIMEGIGCGVSVVCDDGTSYWREIQRASDSGHPVIRVSHGTSEEPGMISLAEYIQRTFPDIKCKHHPHTCEYQLIGWEHSI